MLNNTSRAEAAEFDVLITGGSGFIGTAVANYLLSHGKRVVCLDQRLDERRLATLVGEVTTVETNILDAESVDSWVARCERVIHLAALVGVDEYVKRPLEVLDVNILGTRNVLRACTRHGRPVVFASTSEVYGKNSGTLREDTERVYGSAAKNRWCYAISKSACEHYAYALAGEGLCFAACRYFNVYGPQLDRPGGGRMISKFVGNLLAGEPLALVDGGHAVRCLCYVDDAAEATARLALELTPQASFAGSSINIGREDPVSVREVAQLMIELSGRQVGLRSVSGDEFFGAGFEEIPHRVPSVERLHEAIGFRAHIDMRTGLSWTLDAWGLLAEQPCVPADLPKVPEIQPHFEPDRRLLEEFGLILQSGPATNCGPRLREFEAQAAAFLGVEPSQVVAVANGADAISLVLRVMNLRGKAVLPSYTFIATLNAVVDAGLEPIFCDIDPGTFTLSPSALREVLVRHPEVSCVLPVNVFGVPPELDAIRELADTHDVRVLYDNAHGFGSETHGVRLPPQPCAQTFSFHATKLLPAVEGGLVAAADRAMIDEIKRLRNHGIAADPLASGPGVNSKLDELRAAVGLHGLRRVDEILSRRRRYGQRLRDWFERPALSRFFTLQTVPEGVETNFQNFGALCALDGGLSHETVLEAFRAHGVGCRSYFHPALHHLEGYRERFDLPATDFVWGSWVSLPMHSRMNDEVLRRIELAAAAVAEAYSTPVRYAGMNN